MQTAPSSGSEWVGPRPGSPVNSPQPGPTGVGGVGGTRLGDGESGESGFHRALRSKKLRTLKGREKAGRSVLRLAAKCTK